MRLSVLLFALLFSAGSFGEFTIPTEYNPKHEDCYQLSRAYHLYNVAKNTKQDIKEVSAYIKENYFQDNKEIFHFFLQPDLSRYHKRYDFIIEPMQRYEQCIVEIKYSKYTLESCFKMMYLKDLVWAYKQINAGKDEIHDVLRDQLGRAYYFAENQLKRYVHMSKKKLAQYVKADFLQCLSNRRETILQAKVVEIKSGDRVVVDNQGEKLELSMMGIRAVKDQEVNQAAINYLQNSISNKTIKIQYHEDEEHGKMAILKIRGEFVGEPLIEAGLVKYYRSDFDSSFFVVKDSYARASANAKLKRVGIWKKQKPQFRD